MRNLAYYRAAWDGKNFGIPASEFNKTVNNNFIDVCVLEWCKLFGEHKEPHHWKNIVKNKVSFKSGLLNCLGTDSKGLEDYWNTLRTYRDTFVAHLDSAEIMQIPKMDWAYKSFHYYFEQINIEHQTGIDLNLYYQKCESDAKTIYAIRV